MRHTRFATEPPVKLQLQLSIASVNGLAGAPDTSSIQHQVIDEGAPFKQALVTLAEAADASDPFPAKALADLQAGILTDVHPGAFHLSCGTIQLPRASGAGKLPEARALKKLQHACNAAARQLAEAGSTLFGFCSSNSSQSNVHLRDAITLTGVELAVHNNPYRWDQARGTQFYILKVAIDKPAVAHDLAAWVALVDQLSGFTTKLKDFPKHCHITLRKYNQQHLGRGYSTSPEELLTRLNPLLARHPLHITCGMLQLVTGSNFSMGWTLDSLLPAAAAPQQAARPSALLSLSRPDDDVAVARDVGECDQSGGATAEASMAVALPRPQPLWWLTCSHWHLLDQAMAANLQRLTDSDPALMNVDGAWRRAKPAAAGSAVTGLGLSAIRRPQSAASSVSHRRW